MLTESFQEVDAQFKFAKYRITSDPDDIQSFVSEAVDKNCEGLMIKTLQKDATYEAGKRSLNWLKVFFFFKPENKKN